MDLQKYAAAYHSGLTTRNSLGVLDNYLHNSEARGGTNPTSKKVKLLSSIHNSVMRMGKDYYYLAELPYHLYFVKLVIFVFKGPAVVLSRTLDIFVTPHIMHQFC